MPPAPVMFCGTTIGIAGDVLADMARDQPRLQIVFAADADADQHVDGLAAIEVGDRLRLRRHGRAAQQQAGNNRRRHKRSHERLLLILVRHGSASAQACQTRLSRVVRPLWLRVCELLRRDALLGEERLEHDRLAGARGDHVPGGTGFQCARSASSGSDTTTTLSPDSR